MRYRYVPLVTLLFASPAQTAPSFSDIPLSLNTNAASDTGHDSYIRLATNGAGHWVAVWVSDDPLGGTIGADRDILVSTSDDNGATWTPPVALNSNAATDTDDDSGVRIATDRNGNWVVVWGSSPSGSLQTSEVMVSRSTDNGATWSPQTTLPTDAATNEENDHVAYIATNGIGTWIAIWTRMVMHSVGPNKQRSFSTIYHARSTDNGVTWNASQELAQNGPAIDCYSVRLVAPPVSDLNGNWMVVWSDSCHRGLYGEDYDAFMARSSDDGITWSDPAPINANATTDNPVRVLNLEAGDHELYVRVQTDGIGNWIAVYSCASACSPSNAIVAQRSTDFGTTWSAPVVVNTQIRHAWYGLNAFVTDGHSWLIAGAPPFDSEPDIDISYSVDLGATWSTELLIPGMATDTGGDYRADVATDGAGMWIAAWDSREDLGTLGTDADILYVATELPCGNGNLEPGEACDDGNRRNGDCCDDKCQMEAPDTVCRPAINLCDIAETCSSSTACPADELVNNGELCPDNSTCNGTEICQDGVCVPGTQLNCDDGDTCTRNLCRDPQGCENPPIPGCCETITDCSDDGDPCTDLTGCDSNQCTHTELTTPECTPDAGVVSDAAIHPDASAPAADSGVAVEEETSNCGCSSVDGERTRMRWLVLPWIRSDLR